MSIVGAFEILVGEEWMAGAVCAETDPEIFHPPKGTSAAQAKRVCFSCTVRADCLQFALEHREAGVWGGLTERERMRLRKGQNPLRGRVPLKQNGHGYACRCIICRRPA